MTIRDALARTLMQAALKALAFAAVAAPAGAAAMQAGDAAAAVAADSAVADPSRTASVGMPATIAEIVLPGSLLEPKPADLKSPVVLRLARVFPHGTAFRYDLAWYGLEPGSYDLRDYLRRVDGSATDDLPPIPVEVTSVLPPGVVRPSSPRAGEVAGLGGYRALLFAGGVVWFLGLAVLVMRRRRARRDREDAAAVAARGISLEERLRALVGEALAGPLSPRKRAELELTLVQHWRRRLDLGDLAPADAYEKLKAHPEAGPLVRKLEEWLHRPGSKEELDLEAWLNPYREVLPPRVVPQGPEDRGADGESAPSSGAAAAPSGEGSTWKR